MPRTYWKVLSNYRNSYVVPDTVGGIHYPIGEWVTPKIENSRLFIFDSEESARDWALVRRTLVVPCNAKNIRRKDLKRCRFSMHYTQFWSIWKATKNKSSFNFHGLVEAVPEGTLWATSIKCLA